MSTNQEKVTQLVKDYVTRQSEFCGDVIRNAWHPDGMMYLVGNDGKFRVVSAETQAGHLDDVRRKAPDLQVGFEIDEIEGLTIHDDLIASVHVRWRMVFPDSFGRHRTFFNLANMDGNWVIVNIVDRGFEEKGE